MTPTSRSATILIVFFKLKNFFHEVMECQKTRVCQQVISERIKASSMQKLLMEEKDLLHSQISNLTQEKNRLYLYSHTSLFHSSLHPLRMSEVMARLEERDKHQEASLVAMEKDLALKQQAMETLKKKVPLFDIFLKLVVFLYCLKGPGECADIPESAAGSGWGREGKGESPGEVAAETGGERESGAAVTEVRGTDVEEEEEEEFSVSIGLRKKWPA